MKKRILTKAQVIKIKTKLYTKGMRHIDLCQELPSKPHRTTLTLCLNGNMVNEKIENELLDWLKNADNSQYVRKVEENETINKSIESIEN